MTRPAGFCNGVHRDVPHPFCNLRSQGTRPTNRLLPLSSSGRSIPLHGQFRLQSAAAVALIGVSQANRRPPSSDPAAVDTSTYLTPLVYPVQLPFYKISLILANILSLLPPSRDFTNFLPPLSADRDPQCSRFTTETPPPLLPGPHHAPGMRITLATLRLALQGHDWSIATTPTRPPRPSKIRKDRH